MSTPASSANITPLTGVRALAALWVWLYHAWLVAGNKPIRIDDPDINLTPLFSQGWVGVDLFFVLSGFVLAWPFLGVAGRPFVYRDFLRRRSLRVVPAYYLQFSILLCAGAAGFVWDLPGAASAAFHLALSHNIKEAWAFYEPWWTLPIEWYFYLVFPLLLAAAARHRPWGPLFVLLATAIVWRIAAFFWLNATDPGAAIGTRVWLMHQLPGRIDQFFIGIVAASLTHRLRSTTNAAFLGRLSDWIALSSAASLVLWLYVLAWTYEGYWQGEHGLAFYWNSVAALLLGSFIVGLALEGRFAKLLFANRGMLCLGEISYSIYLWHFAVLVVLMQLGTFAHVGGEYLFPWVIAISLPVTIAVSALSWWLAERPFLRYRRDASESAGRFDRLIASPWPYIALCAGTILGLSWLAGNYWKPAREDLATCTQRSAIDTPAHISAGSPSVTLAGWTSDWNPHDRLRRVVVLAHGAEIAAAPINQERRDVAAVLSACRIGKPGFSLALDTRRVAGGEGELVVLAERRSGARFEIGRIKQTFDQPLRALDTAPSPAWNGDNLFSGWSWHPAGPVVVRWRNADAVLWEGLADRARQDVAEAFPTWKGVEKSGFEFEADMARLPRGRYDTTLEFVAANGSIASEKGPLVENDRPIGKVIAAGAQHFANPKIIRIDAWTFSEHGIAEAMLETESGVAITALPVHRHNAPLTALPDPRFPPNQPAKKTDSERLGTFFRGNIDGTKIPYGLHRLVVRVRDAQGRTTSLPGPLVAKNERPPTKQCPGEKFRVYLVADMEFIRRGVPLLKALRDVAEAGCVEFGLQMRVEYLRTTRGKTGDFAFASDFPERLRYWQGKEMLGVSLDTALAQADKFDVPVRITLDGGVWADSRFSLPDYDIADWLEEDELNVQWNQHGRSEADDALSGLAGATENPQLARMLSLNHYNQPFLAYKKRNLQAAVRLIVAYNQKHPDRPASINLDPDQYINPWFYLSQWYDYNPRTLKQFREWLTHTGIYADGGELAAFRSPGKLTLDEINRMAQASWQSIEEVDPPRKTPDYSSPWHQRWTAFKRHLVARHYADLATWAVEAGLSADQVYTSQTFIQSDVAVMEDDIASGWTDEAGVSLQGAKPMHGHLGAILYGPASRNEGRVRSGNSLLDNIAGMDQRWAVVETHPATIAHPNILPSHRDSYRTIESIFNYGASNMTLMWGSWAGDQTIHPESFRAYDVLEQSAWETQLLSWLREIPDLPLGSRIWPFGNAHHSSDDGFKAHPGSKINARAGVLHLTTEGDKETSGKTGIRRDGFKWPIGRNALLRLRVSHVSGAEAKFYLSGGKIASLPFNPVENGLFECDASGYAGQTLERIDVIFDGKTADIDSLALINKRSDQTHGSHNVR